MATREDKKLTIAGQTFESRLMVGTGKYPTLEIMRDAIAAAAPAMVTVAVRRMNLEQREEKGIMDYLDPQQVTILPNTAGATCAEEAVRLAKLARAAGLSNFIKVEVFGDLDRLLPDPVGTIEATKILADMGFYVMPYTTDDPIVAQRLVEAGAAAVMPGASPIGSGMGFLDFNRISFIIERIGDKVPVIVDSGIGAPSDASLAMEIGADAVLINTAIARAQDPVKMAAAMRQAVIAGRLCYLAGRIPKNPYGSASSPTTGMVK